MTEMFEAENRRKSLVATAVLFGLLFLVLVFFKITSLVDIEVLDGGGGGGEVAVNFGDSDAGMGDNYASLEPVKSAPRQVQTPKAAPEDIVVSENEDAPVIANIKKPVETPKKKPEEPVKPAEKPAPRPSKSTSDALANVLNSSSQGGDGDDKVAGNKGKAYGDPNARGYNGGGGTGTGSGGGNGSGEGIGTGSGYGGGNGSGSGGGNGNYQLGNRKPLNKPVPNYLCDEEGTVVVQISVDRGGRVITANPGIRGTTNAAKCLLDQAKVAAMNTRWQADNDAPDKQVGKIIYNFKLTD